MITELLINSVASYKNPSLIKPKNKISLLYGLNGAGKSTISDFLYNPSDPSYSSCKIKQDQDSEILVYNQKFLSEYFYEEDSLQGIFTLSKENKNVLQSIEQESNNLEVVQRKQQISKQKIESINLRIEQEKEKAISKVWEIKTKYAGGDRVLEFCLENLKRTELLFKHITSIALPTAAPSYSIENLKTEANSIQGEGATPLSTINPINPTWLSIERDEIFSKVIVGSQEGSVAEFISKLGNSDWVKRGLEYIPPHTGDAIYDCPFCQTPTITSQLADSIRKVFDKAYELDISKIESLKANYSISLPSTQFKDISQLPIATKELEGAWNNLIGQLVSTHNENTLLIENKLKSPSTPLKLKDSSSTVASINEVIFKLNALVETHNDKLLHKKRTLDDIKSRFWSLMRWDYEQTLSSYEDSCNKLDKEFQIANQESIDITQKISNSNQKISDLRKQTVNIQDAIDNINNSLLEIGIDGFSVIKHSGNLYRIARSGADSNAFHSLSEGEKTVISFLYFIELCKGQKSAAAVTRNKIVVIDDPISSLSHIYVFNIGQLIKGYFFNDAKYDQVFVLTHSLYFFYELTHTNKEKRDETQHLFRIIKNSNGSSVIPMHYEEIQNDYQSYWSIIKDQSTPPALIANCMRNIIEYFFGFVQKNDFNNVFQKPILSADKFKAFYRYMNRESHSFGQNIFDIKEFDYQVFKDGLRLIFDECGYIEHYNAMMKQQKSQAEHIPA